MAQNGVRTHEIKRGPIQPARHTAQDTPDVPLRPCSSSHEKTPDQPLLSVCTDSMSRIA